MHELKLAAEQLAGVTFSKPREILYPTGHTLDWVVPYLPPEALSEGWVVRAVEVVAKTVVENFDRLSSEIPPITHAAHALKVYRSKVNGS